MIDTDEVTMGVGPKCHVAVDSNTGHVVAGAGYPCVIRFGELQNGTFGAADDSLMFIDDCDTRGEGWDLV